MRTSSPRALCSSGLPCAPGTRIMSPKAAKITSGRSGQREAVVDPAHGQHADRAARAVDQLDVGGQHVLEAEAVDRVGVPAAHLHEAVVPPGSARRRISSQACAMRSESRNSSTNFTAPSPPGRSRAPPPSRPRPRRARRACASDPSASLLADLAHREADVDQHPVAHRGHVVLQQAEVHPAPHAGHLHHREVRGVGDQLDDLSGNGQAHGKPRPVSHLRATMSNVNFTSSFTLSMPPRHRTPGLMPKSLAGRSPHPDRAACRP